MSGPDVKKTAAREALLAMEANFKKGCVGLVEAKINPSAQALTVMYLCIAINPKRETMVSNYVLGLLGLREDSNPVYKKNNLEQLNKLIRALKEHGNEARKEILNYIKDKISKDDYPGQVKPEIIEVLNDKRFDIKIIDLQELLRVCTNGIELIKQSESNSKNSKHTKLAGISGGLFVAGSGITAGYFGGKAAIAAMAAYGASVPTSLGATLIVGAIIIATVAVAMLAYIGYRLIKNALQNSENEKVLKNYEASTNNADQKLSKSVEGFLNESAPEGDLPNIIKGLTK